MICKCPCCGKPMKVDFPPIDLNTNTLSLPDGSRVRLCAIPAEIYHVLVRAYPHAAMTSSIISKVWGVTEGTEWPEKNLAVHISRLRKILDGVGLSIDSIRDQGYRLAKPGEVLSDARIRQRRRANDATMN
jgi:DNA-binding response OmpR family regulator